ncbi:PRC-barrel domain-containing protein [Oceanobacillus sojae]|uniref:PRC-barrel domain-containing protein n=1 Tax=Oceanobacillus sojae TaxID=582851 RepID=UPI0021A71AC6|nr:PRC-barrel domain-containing protein [Oceanobacillus sojae]MCT1903157.1 PRC-barrel domain-containing protein [Oceanobacillus sojae]
MFLGSTLTNLNVHAADGEIGKVKDLYFNDEWNLRFMIVDTRKWLPGKKVLLPYHVKEEINLEEGYIQVDRHKETIRESPKVPEDNDLISSYQGTVLDYFGWNNYKENAVLDSDHGPVTTGNSEYNSRGVPPEPDLAAPDEKQNDNLRSIDEFMEFKVHAKDGKIGMLDDVILTEDGKIQYLVVNSSESYVENSFYLYLSDQVTSVDWFEKDLYLDDSVKGMERVKPFKNKEEVFGHLNHS